MERNWTSYNLLPYGPFSIGSSCLYTVDFTPIRMPVLGLFSRWYGSLWQFHKQYTISVQTGWGKRHTVWCFWNCLVGRPSLDSSHYLVIIRAAKRLPAFPHHSFVFCSPGCPLEIILGLLLFQLTTFYHPTRAIRTVVVRNITWPHVRELFLFKVSRF